VRGEYANEIAAYLERAQQSLEAAKELASSGYFDFAASRAYYTAFYAATAVLLNIFLPPSAQRTQRFLIFIFLCGLGVLCGGFRCQGGQAE